MIEKSCENVVNKENTGRSCDEVFEATKSYLESLPDPQDELIESTSKKRYISYAGINGLRLPIFFHRKEGGKQSLDTRIESGVSVAKKVRGIHMSRLVRIFYQYRNTVFKLESLETILKRQMYELGSKVGNVKLTFCYPINQKSLRSKLEGYQYYPISYEGKIDTTGKFHKYIHMEYTYSSACPCSSALSEHAREFRSQYGVPHSQRSKAFLKIEVSPEATLSIECLHQMCLKALKTEVQVIVKREDEQAFAELNGTHLKFVEDAVRLLHEELDKEPRIKDFHIKCQHYESLHPYDVEAITYKGIPGGFKSGAYS